MKRTLSATAIALLALTACGGTEATPETDPEPEPASPAEPTLKPADELIPNPDGHEIHIRFQWIPDVEDTQPVEAKYHMHTSESDGMVYHTPIMEYDVLPSMDSTQQYETFVYEVPEAGHAAGSVTVTDPPNEGYIACLALEVEQNVVLDYQESQPGEDSVGCYAFTDEDGTYDSGMPPTNENY